MIDTIRNAELQVNKLVKTVTYCGSPSRQTLSDAIDCARLKALVGKPSPSVAGSCEVAAQTVPTTGAGH